MTTRTRQTDGPVAEAVLDMYSAYGDRAGFDAHLHADITIWERDQPDGLFGLPELDALRDQRSASMDGPRPRLSVHELLVDRWESTAAVARYLLRADHPDGTRSTYRVTDVFTGTDATPSDSSAAGTAPDDSAAAGTAPAESTSNAGWRIVHHHSEELQAPPEMDPPADRTASDRPSDGVED